MNTYRINNLEYITSDEEIKEGDYVLNTATKEIYIATEDDIRDFERNRGDEVEDYLTFNFKIKQTTDMDLVNNGVQYKIEAPIKVKDLIEYLQKLDPETEVLLNKKSPRIDYTTPLENINKIFTSQTYNNLKYLTIDI